MIRRPLPFKHAAEFLRGKSVCIVGNAPDLLRFRHGQRIDEHDVVVRMNAGVPELLGRTDALGTRTTILTQGLLQLFKEAWSAGCRPKNVWWMKSVTNLGRLHYKQLLQEFEVPVWVWPKAWEHKVSVALGKRENPDIPHYPTTGLRMVGLCRIFAKPAKVSACGFNFFGLLGGGSPSSTWKVASRMGKLPKNITAGPAPDHEAEWELRVFEHYGMVRKEEQWWEMS